MAYSCLGFKAFDYSPGETVLLLSVSHLFTGTSLSQLSSYLYTNPLSLILPLQPPFPDAVFLMKAPHPNTTSFIKKKKKQMFSSSFRLKEYQFELYYYLLKVCTKSKVFWLLNLRGRLSVPFCTAFWYPTRVDLL